MKNKIGDLADPENDLMKIRFIFLFFIVLGSTVTGVFSQTLSPSPTTDQTKAASAQNLVKKELEIKDDGFRDLHLSITKIELDPEYEDIKTYTVLSTYKGKDVGFLLDIPTPDNDWLFEISFRSMGAPSDEFLNLLAETYGIKPARKLKFARNFSTSYTDLSALAAEMSEPGETPYTVAAKYKLFMGEEEETEALLDIDEKNGIAKFIEKDDYHRRKIVNYLSEKVKAPVKRKKKR